MQDFEEIKASGLLELYVLGKADARQLEEVESYRRIFPEVNLEIESLQSILDEYARSIGRDTEEILHGLPEFRDESIEDLIPPILSASSSLQDFNYWLNDFQLPEDYKGELFVKSIVRGQRSLFILWVKDSLPEEVHTDCHECFLIVSGSCELAIGDMNYHLNEGDYMKVPLHQKHSAVVSSDEPCIAIVQRLYNKVD